MGRVLLLSISLLLASACADRAVAPYPTSPPLPPNAMTELAAGDIFDVLVTGEPDLSHSYQVSDDGTVSLNMIGDVQVEGKTKKQIEQEIEARLRDGFLKQPHVAIIVRDQPSKRVSVFGQVRKPDTFVYRANMSIVEAISLAGGFTPLARKNAVRVTRLGSDKPIYVAVEDIGQGKAPNFFMRPGDVVYVPERAI
jgi:protein involved in polysaccharide export with SLBB domain